MMRFRLIGYLVLLYVFVQPAFASGDLPAASVCKGIVTRHFETHELSTDLIFKDYIFNSPHMWSLILGLLYIPEDVPVLILGETGVGKEFIAKLIHTLSARRSGPYIAVDAGTLSDTLAAAELFGHEKGAFTGATSTKLGLLTAANKGTLFLDEIGVLDPSVQRLLLRALQERAVRSVGSIGEVPVNFRLISASNLDPRDMERDAFRKDLYHRLGVVVVRVPPLRDRVGDVALLSQYFLDQLQVSNNGFVQLEWSSEALEELAAHDWPGNVRQLKNEVARAITVARTRIALEQEQGPFAFQIIKSDLPDEIHVSSSSNGNGLDQIFSHLEPLPLLFEVTQALIAVALERYGGNISRAARAIGMNRSTIHYRLRKPKTDLSPP